MDEVFKALADPTRRSILDALFAEDGQTSGQLEARFAMTRFGVAKHLKLLEEARLVVSKRRGREKLHYLNPVPIRLVHDRWVSKYAEPFAAGLADLKHDLERTMEKVFEVYIRTTPERLWAAITSAEGYAAFQFGNVIDGAVEVGGSYQITHPRAPGVVLGKGVFTEVDPPNRLVQRARMLYSPEVADEPESTITWEINRIDDSDSCCLLVTHSDLREGVHPMMYGGWPMMLSGLKTWLETGDMLTTPGSLMYAGR